MNARRHQPPVAGLLIVGSYHDAHTMAAARGLTPDQWVHVDSPRDLDNERVAPGARYVLTTSAAAAMPVRLWEALEERGHVQDPTS